MVCRAFALLAAVAVVGCGGGGESGEERERLPRDVAASEEREPPAAAKNLPRHGEVTVGGVKLSGNRVQNVMWVSDEVPRRPAALWSRLAARFDETGLWPLLLEAPPAELGLDVGYDWRPAAGKDPLAVLRRQWRENGGSGRFPGIGRGGPPVEDGAKAAVRGMEAVSVLALVPVERPADAPAAIGWTGPVNWYEDPAETSSVLHAWAARYDARVVGLGLDTAPRRGGPPAGG